MAQVSTLLAQIDNGTLLLPEFQRGYVWNRDQVRGFMRSLYYRYPVGSLLVWQTPVDGMRLRGASAAPGVVELLLDGQQRITTLYGLTRGRPPAFFEGRTEPLTGLHFNLDDEVFEYYAPAKMKGNPRWVDVSTVMKEGIGPFVARISSDPELAPRLADYVTRLNRIHQIWQLEFHVEKVTGEDKSLDVVVEIFNRVNSGGTKLSKADLALAKLCAEWADARGHLRRAVGNWNKVGYRFSLDWFLRVATAVVTGDARFEALDGVDAEVFGKGLTSAEKAVDHLLNNLAAHLGLDHDRVLAGRYSFPVMARLLDQQGGKLKDAQQRNRLLFWYLQAALWGRFSGSTESTLNQDLKACDAEGIDGLIETMRRWRGDLRVRPEDFSGYGMGARFYPLLYVLTRTMKARDFWDGALVLSEGLLGKGSKLQVHHLFPKARLYEKGYLRAEVNAVANFCFLTQDTNLWVGAREPAEYFSLVEEKYPGALASQWVPLDRELWSLDNYRGFLAARRRLLADAANSLLDGLLAGAADEAVEPLRPIAVSLESEDTYPEIGQLAEWLSQNGYAKPELDVEIDDPETNEPICVAEGYWPAGLQTGMGEPVVLEYELTDESEARLVALGFRAFPTVSSLREFVDRQISERQGLAAAEDGVPGMAEARSEHTPRGQLYQRFWTLYLAEVRRRHPDWSRARKAPAEGWMSLPSPIRGTELNPSFAMGGRLRHEIYIDTGDGARNLEIFRALEGQREAMEAAYGRSLDFEELPDARACRIAEYRPGEVTDEQAHGQYVEWFLDAGERLRRALGAVSLPPG